MLRRPSEGRLTGVHAYNAVVGSQVCRMGRGKASECKCLRRGPLSICIIIRLPANTCNHPDIGAPTTQGYIIPMLD